MATSVGPLIYKVTFNTRKDLLVVIYNRIKVVELRFIMEEFKPVLRVIKCNRCEVFGARCCLETSQCGKCGIKIMKVTHTKEMCSLQKIWTYYWGQSYKVMKLQKLDEIKQQSQYGF